MAYNRNLFSHNIKATSPKSRCRQDLFLLDVLRVNHSMAFACLLMAAEHPWHPLACSCTTLISVWLFTSPSSPCMSSPLLTQKFVIRFRAHSENLTRSSLHIFNLTILQRPFIFPNEVTFTPSRWTCHWKEVIAIHYEDVLK